MRIKGNINEIEPDGPGKVKKDTNKIFNEKMK